MYDIDQSILFIFAVAAFYLSVEIGFRFGCRAVKIHGQEVYQHVATIEAALLGLLALLLGFAFSMAMARYDSRRSVVVQEANDLQTTYLRSKLLASPFREDVGQLLLAYVDSRVDYLRAGVDRVKASAALDQSSSLQSQLWNLSLSAAAANSNEVTTGYFIESLNGLIDDHSERLAAMESHVPDIIIGLLLFVAAMTLAMSGYSSGYHGTRLLVPRFIVIVLIAATLLVIIDLDRPRRGFIKVSERAMSELYAQMHRELEVK